MNDTNALDDGGNLGGGTTVVAPQDGELFGLVENLPEAEYHAHPALSSTGARLLLDCPARFKYRQDHPRPPKDEFDLGSAIHSKVLGTGYGIAVLDYPDWRTKAAQTERDEAREQGLIPVLKKTTLIVDDIAEAVLAHPTARKLIEQPHIAEASVFATDPATSVRMRARFDIYPEEAGGVAVDLKSIGTSASSRDFAKSAAAYGYSVQEAHYLDTLRFASGDTDTRMVFIVVETDAPYFVAVHQLDDQFAYIGQDEARRAREIYARCLDANEWPAYPTDIIQTSPPSWLVYRHQEQYEQEIEVA